MFFKFIRMIKRNWLIPVIYAPVSFCSCSENEKKMEIRSQNVSFSCSACFSNCRPINLASSFNALIIISDILRARISIQYRILWSLPFRFLVCHKFSSFYTAEYFAAVGMTILAQPKSSFWLYDCQNSKWSKFELKWHCHKHKYLLAIVYITLHRTTTKKN